MKSNIILYSLTSSQEALVNKTLFPLGLKLEHFYFY